MFIIIKGTRDEAFRAAKIRGVVVKSLVEIRPGECHGLADSKQLDKIIAWWCEDRDPPYSVGTCLYYSLKSNDRRLPDDHEDI